MRLAGLHVAPIDDRISEVTHRGYRVWPLDPTQLPPPPPPGTQPPPPGTQPPPPIQPPGTLPPAPNSASWPAINIPVSGGYYTPADVGGSQNVRLVWPNEAVHGRIRLQNFANIHSVGGFHDGADVPLDQHKLPIWLRNLHTNGVYYFEGLHIKAYGRIVTLFRVESDNMGRDGHCNIYWVNCRLGTPEYLLRAHGDLMHFTAGGRTAPAPRLNIHNCTLMTTVTGLMLGDRTANDKRIKNNQAGLHIKRANFRAEEAAPTSVLRANYPNENLSGRRTSISWFMLVGSGPTNEPYNNAWYDCSFEDCYFDPGSSPKPVHKLFLPLDRDSSDLVYGLRGPGGPTVHPDGSFTWPNTGDVEYLGKIQPGPPPDGDFVPENMLFPSKIYDRADFEGNAPPPGTQPPPPKPTPPPTDPNDWRGPTRPNSANWPVLRIGPNGGTYNPGNVGGAQSVRVQMPTAPIQGASPGYVVLNNFRNVHLVGGQIVAGKHNALENADGLLRLENCYEDGVYYIEGIHLLSDGWIADLIRIQTPRYMNRGGSMNVYFVNMRIDGPEYGVKKGFHGDMCQVTGASNKGPATKLELYNVTANCVGQGFMFNDRTFSGHVYNDRNKMDKKNQAGFKASRSNFFVQAGIPAQQVFNRHRGMPGGAPQRVSDIIKGGLKLLFLGTQDDPANSSFKVFWYDVEFGPEVHVYSTVNTKGPFELVRPPPRGDQVLNGRRGPGNPNKAADGSITYPNPVPNDCRYTGRVLATVPAGGDFAPRNKVGLNYDPNDPVWNR